MAASVREIIALLSLVPDALKDHSVEFFNTGNGQKFTLREDVTQLGMRGGVIQLFIETSTEG